MAPRILVRDLAPTLISGRRMGEYNPPVLKQPDFPTWPLFLTAPDQGKFR